MIVSEWVMTVRRWKASFSSLAMKWVQVPEFRPTTASSSMNSTTFRAISIFSLRWMFFLDWNEDSSSFESRSTAPPWTLLMSPCFSSDSMSRRTVSLLQPNSDTREDIDIEPRSLKIVMILVSRSFCIIDRFLSGTDRSLMNAAAMPALRFTQFRNLRSLLPIGKIVRQ
jgi:hypothetical protein